MMVSRQRLARQRWRTDAIDAVDAAPECRMNCWGVPIRMRWASPWLRTHRPLTQGDGRRFDLTPNAALEWEDMPTPPGFPCQLEGGLVKERIVLDRRPSTGIFTFHLLSPRGTRFVYQPPLTPEERDRGDRRPPPVVHSFAVKDGAGVKVGHLFRPFAVDADGLRTPLRLYLQRVNPRVVEARIIVPATLLDSAHYPLVVDPYFGKTAAGLSTSSWAVNVLRASGTHAPGEDGTATAMEIYCANASGDAITMGIYADSSGPAALLKDTAELVPGAATAAWYSVALDSSLAITNGTNYWLGSRTGTGNITAYYDATGGAPCALKVKSSTYVAGVMPNPFTAGYSSYNSDFSFRVEYTAAATFVPYPHLHGLDGGMSTLSGGSAQE